jgi:hypothetical protein
MKLPIATDAVPIANRSPYSRIDPRYPDRTAVATRNQLAARLRNGAKLADLEAIYRYDHDHDLYYLKPEFF